MPEGQAIREGVRRYILDTFLIGEPPESLKDSTSLLLTGIVSSLAMLELVAFLEHEFGVTFRPDDLAPEQLDSVDRIVSLVLTRQAGV